MQRKILSIILFIICTLGALSSQSQITRGAVEEEIYLSTSWYADNDGVHYAIYHSTDNGETIELKYENLETPPEDEMKIGRVLGDADAGALYNYRSNELWSSFDFGETWVSRQNSYGYGQYFTGEDSGKIFRGDTAFSVSTDFGSSFEVLPVDAICPFTEIGFTEAEFYGIYGVAGSYYHFVHTIDYGQSCTETSIDSTVAFWAPGGHYPQISRGTQSGEIYLVSWWLNSTYKIFYSTDTGNTWTEQFESEYIDAYEISYSAGREPGSFYVMHSQLSESCDHILLYIDYSSDYGQTFTSWFHNLDSLYTSVHKINKDKIEISAYPNPFSIKTTITCKLPENCNNAVLQIYNIHGDLIKQYSLKTNKKQLWNGRDENENRVPKGIYLYNVKYNSFQSQTKKLIIQ